MLLVRIGAPIYFANTQHISERLRRFEARAQVRVLPPAADKPSSTCRNTPLEYTFCKLFT